MSSSHRFYRSKIFFPKWDKYHIHQDHKLFLSFGIYGRCIYEVGVLLNPRLSTRGLLIRVKLIVFEFSLSFKFRYEEDVPKKLKPKK